MEYKFIETYSDFVLNETLKTIDIDKTIESVERELLLMKFEFLLNKINNKINLHIILNKKDKKNFIKEIDYILSLLTDRFGWFPSKMELTNNRGMKIVLKYDKNDIIERFNSIYSYKIEFEAKDDNIEDLPEKLYHLSIQEYEDKINKNGLCLKSKSKISKHLHRIYVCKDVKHCYKLIPNMKFNYDNIKFYNHKNNIDDGWIIYEIDCKDLDIKIFNDPNYEGGYYLIDNIHPDRLKIYDKE